MINTQEEFVRLLLEECPDVPYVTITRHVSLYNYEKYEWTTGFRLTTIQAAHRQQLFNFMCKHGIALNPHSAYNYGKTLMVYQPYLDQKVRRYRIDLRD